MPVLEINGNYIAQSNNILRLVGKATKLYPSDPVEATKVDELIDAVEDVMKELGKSVGEQGKKKKKKFFILIKKLKIIKIHKRK